MGLAERFKEKLNKKDIFKKNSIETTLEINNIKFISKPVTENITIQPKKIHTEISEPIESIKSISGNSKTSPNKFEDIETEIIDKIRKTPYWEEYSPERQVNMISTYFDKKSATTYSDISYTENERIEFIQNILALANNR